MLMATFCSTRTLFKNHISPEDQEEIAGITRNIASLEGQESDEEYYIYLSDRRSFINTMIRRIDFLLRKYQHHPTTENLREAHDYLKRTMTRFGLA